MKPYPEGLPEFTRAVCEKYSRDEVAAFIQALRMTAAIDDMWNPLRHRR